MNVYEFFFSFALFGLICNLYFDFEEFQVLVFSFILLNAAKIL